MLRRQWNVQAVSSSRLLRSCCDWALLLSVGLCLGSLAVAGCLAAPLLLVLEENRGGKQAPGVPCTSKY